MSKIERFEDILGWQRGRELVKSVCEVTAEPQFARDFALTNQIRKAVVSIPSNIAEGYERDTTKEYHHFVSISKASCAEVRTQLYIAHDLGYLDETRFRAVMALAAETGRVIGGLRASLHRKLLGPRPSALGT